MENITHFIKTISAASVMMLIFFPVIVTPVLAGQSRPEAMAVFYVQ